MRRTRIFSIVLFIVAIVSFGVFQINEIKIQDHAGPKITMDKETITVTSAASDEELLAGVTAEDERDKDVTDSLIIESKSNFIKKGRRKITIAAFDSSNNVTKVSREVVYSDYHSPRFALEKPLRFPLGTQDIQSGIEVLDILDGNLSGNIKVSEEYILQADKPGDYPMVFTVANSAGDVSKLPVTVQIYDPAEETRAPQIELSQYIVYIDKEASLNPWDYVQAVTIGSITYQRREDGILYDPEASEGQEKVSISQEEMQISDNKKNKKEGVYEITYRLETENNGTGQVRMIVVTNNERRRSGGK